MCHWLTLMFFAAKDGLGDYFNELRRRKFPVSDLVVSLLHKETDMMNEIAFAAQGPQADLQAAGYQLLMPRFSEHTESHPNVPSRAAMIRDMLTDLKNAGTIKYTSAALMKADVKKGRGKNKPYTFIHIMRGNGISALKGIVLAPFVATNAVSRSAASEHCWQPRTSASGDSGEDSRTS